MTKTLIFLSWTIINLNGRSAGESILRFEYLLSPETDPHPSPDQSNVAASRMYPCNGTDGEIPLTFFRKQFVCLPPIYSIFIAKTTA